MSTTRSTGRHAAGILPGATPATPQSRQAATARPTNWTATIGALDDARAKAFVARSVDLLDAVYTRDSAARSADARMIRSLLTGHLRVSGARHLVQQARQLGGTPIRVVVHDTMPSYPILDAAGKVVGRTTPRPAAARVLVLVLTTDGYRISQVQPA
jgi:hypothetical protein